MSRLSARSANIRKVFTDLTTNSGGVCCLFDAGDDAPEQVCWLNGEQCSGLVDQLLWRAREGRTFPSE
jgi:hypothetical protein